MTDDVEETLASLEQRLRALQAELDADEVAPLVEEPPRAEARRFTPRAVPPPAPAAPAPAAPPAAAPEPADALDRFGAELRRLVDVWDRTVADLRNGGAEQVIFRGGVALEARADLRGLCALDRALGTVPGVQRVTLRAYAGGAAALEVALDGEVALVPALRAALDFDVIAADPRRLTIALRP
jgi:hypothetical protein